MSRVIASTYEIREKIGSGGGGIVYLGYHLRLNKKVVLKEDKRKITTKPELLRREVDTLKNISHTYIPQVYDFIEENGYTYTVMDYIEGESFDKLLERGERFSQAQIIEWACQLLEALSYLHHCPPHGILHADIKPSNIMLTPQNDIRLIDFNIALALGEEGAVAVGRSFGYASPEHYGSDVLLGGQTASLWGSLRNDADKTELMKPEEYPCEEEKTEAMTDQIALGAVEETERLTELLTGQETPAAAVIRKNIERSAGFDGKKGKLLDVRSDIYSLGATLYHFFSGKKPAREAMKVEPLPDTQISPAVIAIIKKAMAPEPEERFQTAEEMLYAFEHLHQEDSRTKKYKKTVKITTTCLVALFLVGTVAAMTGLKQMEREQKAYALAETAENVLQKGDMSSALGYALKALRESDMLLGNANIPQAESVLADALHIYDLSDGFRNNGMIELPAAPQCIAISPEGETISAIHDGVLSVAKLSNMEIQREFPAERSALSQVEYLDEDTIVFAGKTGLAACDIKTGETIWTAEKTTAVSVSADKNMVAAVYKDEGHARVYRAADGTLLQQLDFRGKKQTVTRNDIFANPKDSLLALNKDGSMLAVSFEDGSLWLYALAEGMEDVELFDGTSGFTHYEGGFFGDYFAFAASGSENNVFAVIDTANVVQTGGFESESPFSVQADETGIYVQTENLLVKLHPVTGEQTPMVTTAESIHHFSVCGGTSIIATNSGYSFFDRQAELITHIDAEKGEKILRMADGVAVAGSMDKTGMRVFSLETRADSRRFSYEPSYPHDEARISSDGKTAMLFSYRGFRIYDLNGECLVEREFSDADEVYDQQYRRDENGSYLKVIYDDGRILRYSALDGKLLEESKGEKPDLSLYEEFFTDSLRIESPLHGTPAAYDKKSGKLIKYLEKDDYLTYVTQLDSGILTEYVTADGERYGLLLNERCETLARLPGLCDVLEDKLIFDYHKGELRGTRIYHKDELEKLAQEQLERRGR